MNSENAVASLAALAHPLRLSIFRSLVVAGHEGITPGVLQADLQAAPATLSFHLKELAQSGLVTQERVSRNLVYRADMSNMYALLGFLTENCCQGQTCAPGDDNTGSTCCSPETAEAGAA